MDLGLQGKVAIVTGGSAGIGLATAGRLVAEGASVVITGRREDVLRRAAGGLAGPGAVLPVPGDVTQGGHAEHVVDVARREFGRVDILVNNAGTALAKPFDQATDEDWAADLDLKLWAAVRFVRAVLPEFRRLGGGRIVNVTALGGRTPGAGSVPTSVSRAAGIALTKALSKDLGADGIGVNTVCIGLVRSEQHERAHQRRRPDLSLEEFYADLARDVPLGRVGEAAEAADLIAFLVSERAGYLTGVAVNVDGGLSPVV
jgi:NAD(P)-dependent dehydrogenase (short-subunit alcohol dehydrogenase family)